jgi:phosphatidylethanolamine-binding protein (PEBP) family uncharacterized protein
MLGARAGCVLRFMAGVVAAHAVLFAEAQAAMSLTLTSSAFEPGGKIPAEYTCEGEDISPPLTIGGVPDGTKSLALILDDPDAPDPAAPKRVWVHWVVYNLSPGTSALPEGANTKLPAKPMIKAELEAAMKGHVLAKAELVATYQKGDP